MKHYELFCLIPPDLPEEFLRALEEKIESFIKEGGGVLTKKSTVKRKLGYPVKNHDLAYFISAEFSFAPEKLEDLRKKIGSENEIIRFSISARQRSEIKDYPIRKAKIRKNSTAKNEAGKDEKTGRAKEKKVELKNIEEKLEEILNPVRNSTF